jgi:hypothetical protein
MSWRDGIRVHPAADLFPMMSDAELDDLAADIAKNGLLELPMWFRERNGERALLDGRNRIAAIYRVHDPRIRTPLWREALSKAFPIKRDPYDYVVSRNIQRRHLTPALKRDLIAKLLRANPERSDRATARVVHADHKTVAAVRADAEARGEIPHVETRSDSAGRRQPARKRVAPVDPTPVLDVADEPPLPFPAQAQAHVIPLADRQAQDARALPAQLRNIRTAAPELDTKQVVDALNTMQKRERLRIEGQIGDELNALWPVVEQLMDLRNIIAVRLSER